MESEFELAWRRARRGKPAFALVGEPGTRKYVGMPSSASIARRASGFGSASRSMPARQTRHEEAAGNAVGETGHESLREALALRGRSSARLAFPKLWED